MKCPRCEADNRPGVAFCEDCGAPFGLTCPACSASTTPGKKFCGACGAPLTARETSLVTPGQG
ncbi:MAG: double zinc ribbon domain-containing protein, partial [Candidatus Rokuibacteriota bacterium]